MRQISDPTPRMVLRSEELPWGRSPASGVQCRVFTREGTGDARATSIVRYQPGATTLLSPNSHGEEMMVLDGEFADDYGVYPAGTYLKIPPGPMRTQGSVFGCTLFVRPCQLTESSLTRVVVRPSDWNWHPGLVSGLEVLTLDQVGATHTALVRWAPGTVFNEHTHFGGEEIFVLEGTFQDEHGDYPLGTWIRSPHMSSHRPYSDSGCLIYVKVGHLL